MRSRYLLLLSFFFYCYGDHRDLHSFPTRRSSDLMYQGEIFNPSTTRLVNGVPVRDGYGFDPDRKSTRLNSSHVKISYAVFCLKKKKNRHTSTKPPGVEDTASCNGEASCTQSTDSR